MAAKGSPRSPQGSNKAGAEVDESQAGGGLVVTAPLVQIQVGTRVIHLSEGDVVPNNASQESLDHLRDLGFVTESE